MLLYSLMLVAVLVVGAPYWLLRMATSGRYRAGLAQRLGRVPAALRAVAAGRKIVWLHAVSVGEVLAVSRLVGELEQALGDGWRIVISTTTATGQTLARRHFGQSDAGMDRVFFYPLDFGWAVRAYLRALKPRALILTESELWPRMLVECEREGIPVAVMNARVSDRSFARGMKVKGWWSKLLQRVTLFLAQSEEDGRRLESMGARAESVRVLGNLKYDVRAPKASQIAEWIRAVAAGRPIILAGSTHGRLKDDRLSEDEMVIQAWSGKARTHAKALLVLAPRHPERFAEVAAMAGEYRLAKASTAQEISPDAGTEIVLLDTIGDLAAAYAVVDIAFVGGSLVKHGGHNPLEPAQFGIPVVMGASFENFRDMVARMRAAEGIRIVPDSVWLEAALIEMLTHPEAAKAMGMRGRRVFEEQQGATARTVDVIAELVRR